MKNIYFDNRQTENADRADSQKTKRPIYFSSKENIDEVKEERDVNKMTDTYNLNLNNNFFCDWQLG